MEQHCKVLTSDGYCTHIHMSGFSIVSMRLCVFDKYTSLGLTEFNRQLTIS